MRPLPIDSFFVRALDRALHWLPRRTHEAALRPLGHVVATDEGERAWRATGDDPAFHLLDDLPPTARSGWYYVEGYLRKHSTTLTKLYIDTGAGYDEDQVISLPVTRRGYIREVVRLPAGTRAMRLDPIETEGGFVFEWMSIAAIGTLEAALRRLGRVLFDHHRFSRQEETREAARSDLLSPLVRCDLRAAYSASARMRIPMQRNDLTTELWRTYRRRLGETLPSLAHQAAAVPGHPLISVVVPTYETPPHLLLAMLDSVQSQVYPHWELVVWDDASTTHETRRLVADRAARDPRIRPLGHAVNTGVSGATNAAIAATTGAYVVFLDHDDELEPQALLRIAQCAAAELPDFAYSDEVIVNASGDEVMDLVLRPAFSLEYFRHHPYIVHLLAFRRAFLVELGGLDVTLRVSQDVDLILRAAERARSIAHIPEVLYRWRTLASSSGHARRAEVCAATVGALERHLERCGEPAVVEAEAGRFNFYRPRYPIAAHTRVAVVIPTKNHHELLRLCVENLERTITGLNVDLIVIDHDSDEPASRTYLDALKGRHTVLHHSGPFNFSTINNAAVDRLPGVYSHLLFCNNDVEAIDHGWLHTMLGLAARPDVGIVGAHLVYGDRISVQHAGVGVGMFGAAEHFGKFLPHATDAAGARNLGYRGALVVAREVSAVTAACLLIRSECFEALGGFDEQLAVGFGDIDLCLRAVEKGWRVIQSGGSVLVHHESKTRGTSTSDPHPLDSARFQARWKPYMGRGDPYFHPALSEVSTAWLYRHPFPVADTPLWRLWRPARRTPQFHSSAMAMPLAA